MRGWCFPGSAWVQKGLGRLIIANVDSTVCNVVLGRQLIVLPPPFHFQVSRGNYTFFDKHLVQVPK